MILAVGCLVDLQNRKADHPDAEKYHQLARASLCEIPVMQETNVETITALFYEIWYLLVFFDKKKAAGYTWGLSFALVDRNGGKSKVINIPEEVNKGESHSSLQLFVIARPTTFTIRINHMDCPQPRTTISSSSHNCKLSSPNSQNDG